MFFQSFELIKHVVYCNVEIHCGLSGNIVLSQIKQVECLISGQDQNLILFHRKTI